MDATFLLADWAEAINGKLYVQGGGWNIYRAQGPVRCAVAVLLAVNWGEANEKHRATIRLLDTDGQPVEPHPGKPVVVDTQFEVGRPAGVQQGSDLHVPLAVNFQLPLQAGRYRFVLELDGAPTSSGATFDVTVGVPKQEG